MQHQDRRLGRMWWVVEQTGCSRSAIYEKLDPRSPRFDPTFPRPRKISQRAVAWEEAEIGEWISSLRRG